MAIMVILILPVMFALLALALDAGLWYLDHRIAQNQADAAVLAAVQLLPSEDPGNGRPPTRAVYDWLKKNGSAPGDLSHCPESSPPADFVPRPGLEYLDLHPKSNPDGRYDAVRVCVRRKSPGIFSQMSGIPFIYISATATARVGPTGMANVLPWGVVPPDPYCDERGDECLNEYGESCGYFPPVLPGQDVCPWGLDLNKLYAFKISDPAAYTPGNFGALASCGGGTSDYRACIEGKTNSGFFAEGEYVNVGAQTGVGGANTNTALNNRYADESIIGTGADGAPLLECDIEATPDPDTGLDPDGKNAAKAMFLPYTACQRRLVAIPIIESFPSSGSSEDILVLGIATFGIAKWDRVADPAWGDALATDSPGEACGEPSLDTGYPCGMVWGYIIEDNVTPPHFLLQRISEGDNPLAPNMVALVE